jgi:hypothetical protein
MLKSESNISLLLSAVIGSLAVATTANRASAVPQDFIIENQTKVDLVEIYISASPATNWEHNLLAQQVLKSGDKNVVRFYGDLSECVYDIRTVFGDGDIIKSEGVDLCKTNTYTLTDR